MKDPCFVCVAMTLFLFIGTAHLVRVFLGWDIMINGWVLPNEMSIIAGLSLLAMAVWGIRVRRHVHAT